MIYKALICDIDGTLIPKDGLISPSQNVRNAIVKAQKNVHVATATSRPYRLSKHIFQSLGLVGPSIINGGSQIVNTQTGEILWEQLMKKKDIITVSQQLQSLHLPFWINDNDYDVVYTKTYQPKNPIDIIAHSLTESQAEEIITSLSSLSTISLHKITAGKKGHFYVHITHVKATKKTALFELLKLLNIKKSQTIGIGDGYNDFPLLMGCGFKIAMENAVDELKTIADYIAPSVEDDGVAHVIKKFVLQG